MSNITPDSTWEDLVFEGRNKAYGAYALRYGYPYYLILSALFVIALFLSVMVGPRLFRDAQTQPEDRDIVLPVRPVEPVKPPTVEKNNLPKTHAVRYQAPEITRGEVKEYQQMPTQEEAIVLADNSVVDKPIAVVENPGAASVEPAPPAIIEEARIPDPLPDIIRNPEFPGGMKECARWLSSHLEYPVMAIRMGIEGKVVVEFTVDENGKISDAAVIEKLHRLCDQEAIRLVKSMPDWTPGEKNGVRTAQRYTLPIRFVLH